MFSFNFWAKVTLLQSLPLHSGQFWPFSKTCHFSNISCFLKRFFAQSISNEGSIVVFRMIVSWLLIFERNSPFCKAYSLCIVANFDHFQKLVIFRILGVFWSRFLHRVTLISSVVFRMIISILIFERNSPLCKAYSLSIVANFGHFQKLVIFRILGVFWSRFLHRVTLMRCQCPFSHLLFNFIFWAKVTLLQSL